VIFGLEYVLCQVLRKCSVFDKLRKVVVQGTRLLYICSTAPRGDHSLPAALAARSADNYVAYSLSLERYVRDILDLRHPEPRCAW